MRVDFKYALSRADSMPASGDFKYAIVNTKGQVLALFTNVDGNWAPTITDYIDGASDNHARLVYVVGS